MTFQDLLTLYEQKKARYGSSAVQHISELLREAKTLHKKDWLRAPTAQKDHEQSWRAFKGKALERLLLHIVEDEVHALGLQVVSGNTLERTATDHLSE